MKFPTPSAITLIPLLTLTAIPLQSATGQTTAEDRPETPEESTSPDGYQLGSFLVRPELGVSLMYDSNIYATRTDEVDDSITLISPSVNLRSQWARHKLNLSAGATAAHYSATDSENYEDYWADAEGRYDLSSETNLFGGLGYARDHEDRSSPDDTLVGGGPTTFDSQRAHGGIAHGWGKLSVRLGSTFEALDYQDAGSVNQDDRDRDLIGLGARLNYRLNPRYVVFGQVVRDIRAYDQPVDDNNLDRDSRGNRFGIGFNGIFSNRLNGSATLGYLNQSYDDATFSDVSSIDFSGRLTFRATAATNLVASIERTLEETTLNNASGYLYTASSLEAVHRIDGRLRATAGITAARADYQGISRNDDSYSAEIGLRYMLSPRMYLAASYRVLTRDSNQRDIVLNDANPQETDDFSRQQLFLTLGTLLYPVHNTQLSALSGSDYLKLSPFDWRGFYVGGQLAHGSSGFHNNGERGGSGTDQGEYADAGAGAGLFAGYGRTFNRWYLGIEAEADRATTNVYHRKDKSDSRTLDIGRDDSYGLSLRGGYKLAGGDLLYLRLGRVRTDFDTYYTLNSEVQNAVDKTTALDGTRYGIGTDIPAGKHLFVRMDYSHTDYDDLVADLVTSVETFIPAESYFRLGLGWQFDGTEQNDISAQAIDLNGFYAGANLGHGSLNSHLAGTHYDSGTGPYDFIGDFGHNAGVTGGAFAGWGTTWNRWYAGAEATSESSTANWTHIRDPNGRNFSVEKKDTYGLGLRGGYQLPNGTLLYAHTDRVRTRFNTRWSKGGNSSNDIDRDDRQNGTRVGIGAEMPATRSLFVRMDYSYTDYDDYSFTTGHGNPDSMTFDNSETLFRLGLGMRF